VGKSRTIIIAGAGIAGLTAALSLANAGFRVQVIEKAKTIDTAGVGIQLSPNATRILAGLGLSRAISAAGFTPENVIITNGATGTILSRLPLGESIRTRHEFPYLVLHRADLAAILLAAARENPEISVDFATSFEDAAMYSNGVTVMALRAGEMVEYSGCALIGADGVGSLVRERIVKGAPAKPAGEVAWRALVPVEKLHPYTDLTNTRLWIAKNGHVVTYPVRASRMLNIVAITPKETGRKLSRRVEDIAPDRLLAFFNEWSDDVCQLLASADNWSGWPLREINPAGHWTKKTTALIGDAAHAMLPYLAQGGAAAIEDAMVLAKCLAQQPEDIPLALGKYSNQRKLRTRKIWHTARKYGRIYHMRGLSAVGRDIFLRTANSRLLGNFSANRLQSQMDWLYGWKG